MIFCIEGETDAFEFIDVRGAASFAKGFPHGFKNA